MRGNTSRRRCLAAPHCSARPQTPPSPLQRYMDELHSRKILSIAATPHEIL